MLAPRARAIEGDRITAIHRLQGESTRFADAVLEPAPADVAQRLEQWRNYYRMGVRGPVEWVILPSTGPPRLPTLDRPAIWNSKADGWARRHLGMIVQMSVFTGAAFILLLMRSNDLTAGLCVLALAFSAVGGGGPLLGEERILPFGCRDADRLRVDREPAGLSDHRSGDPLLPDAIAPARSHAVAARDSGRRGAAARHSGTGHRALPCGRRRCPWPRASGTPRIRASTTAPSPSRWRSTCSRSSKACIATASTTTPTSGAGSGWRSTPPCPASSPTRSRTASRSSPRSSIVEPPEYPVA